MEENDNIVNNLVEVHSSRISELKLQMQSLAPKNMDDVRAKFTLWKEINHRTNLKKLFKVSSMKELARHNRELKFPIIREYDQYLATEPEGADEEHLILWRKMKLLDFAKFEEYWTRVDDQRIDLRGCVFKDHPTKKGKKTFRNKVGHGMVRSVAENKIIGI